MSTDKPQGHTDEYFMSKALQLAARGLYSTMPNPRVGCVIVKNEKIVGEGWHLKAGDAHAEVTAIQNAGPQTAGATLFVSLEPCSHIGQTPPCVEGIIEAGISRVVFGSKDPNPLVDGKVQPG